MKTNTEELLKKLRDYHLFIGTLIVLGSYMYMGAIINIYVRPSGDGKTCVFLSLAFLAAGAVGLLRAKQIRIQIDEEERV